MAHEVPFTQAKYVVEDDIIPNNSKAEHPVTFHLSPAAGPDRARLKSVIYATASLSSPDTWTREIQDAVVAAFGSGGEVFVRTVDKVENLSVPVLMAKKAHLIPPDQWDKYPDGGPAIPVKTGLDFAMISGWVQSLAFCVAMEVAKLSRSLESMDARLFQQPSGSSSAAMRKQTRSTARNARKRPGRRGTAG